MVGTGDWVWSLSQGFIYFKSEYNLKTFLGVGSRSQEKVRKEGQELGGDKMKAERAKKRFGKTGRHNPISIP